MNASIDLPPMVHELGLQQPTSATTTRRDPRPLIETIGKGFAQTFAEVNAQHQAADQKIAEFATSENKDLHGTMIAMQKADLSLRLMLAVRGKILAAYREINQVQF